MPAVDKGSEALRQFLINLAVDDQFRAAYGAAVVRDRGGDPTALDAIMAAGMLLEVDKVALRTRNRALLRSQECNVQVSGSALKRAARRKTAKGASKRVRKANPSRRRRAKRARK